MTALYVRHPLSQCRRHLLSSQVCPLSLSQRSHLQRFHLHTTSSSTMDPVFADGVDPAQNTTPVRSLIEQNLWSLDADRMGVAKTYYFKTYTKCLDFVQVVGIRSKSKNHHSTMTIKSGSVHVHWTTHVPRGLSEKDIQMAQYCDQQAGLIGTVERGDANKCGPTGKTGSSDTNK